VSERRADAASLGSHEGRTALLLGGVVQSVAVAPGAPEPEGYWRWLLPPERPRRVLVLGLGGGTVVRLLTLRFPGQPVEVVGVDDDPAVLELARKAFGLDLSGLRVVQEDAAVALRALALADDRFDLVIVDLFRCGSVPDLVCSRRFLSDLRRVLTPDGLLAANLNRGPGRAAQIRRLSRVFVPERAVGTGMNLVVHARPRPRRRYKTHAHLLEP
jgi:spermidine synthase